MRTRRMPQTVVPLLPVDKIERGTGNWMTWGEARRNGVRIPRHIKRAVGPRRRGVVYRSGYWGTLNTVHQVFLEVGEVTHRGRTVKSAVWYRIVEQSIDDVPWRIRRHCTSWNWSGPGSRDEALFTIEVISENGG